MVFQEWNCSKETLPTMEKSGDLEQFKLLENRSDSQCCSGSQSGWTLYLDQSQSLGTTSSVLQEEEDEETEEDLSMLSDASSGPPHPHDDEENYSSSCSEEGEHENKRRRVEEGHREEHYSGDSAGDSLSSISKDTDFQDEQSSFSATHF